MSKFIVISEPHISSSNIEGRQDYIGEIRQYMNEILDSIITDTTIKWVCFVGDIFNRGFNDIDEYFEWTDWFVDLDKMITERGGKIYSAIGNHELSFSKANPFWRLTSKRDGGYNTNMKWLDKAASPKGIRSLIHVEDVVDFGDNVTVFFCHYGALEYCKNLVDKHIAEYGNTKKRVCICHNSIISSPIAKVLRDNYGRDPLTHFIEHEKIESLDLFHKFDYVFNGHMHKAYSRFTLTDESNGHKTQLMYLGSIGRTNSDEINNDDLERCCPYIDVDTMLYGAYAIDLLPREKVLVSGYDVKKVEKHFEKETYEAICRTIVDLGNPIKEIKDALTDTRMAVALECAVNGSVPQEMLNILESVNEVKYGG